MRGWQAGRRPNRRLAGLVVLALVVASLFLANRAPRIEPVPATSPSEPSQPPRDGLTDLERSRGMPLDMRLPPEPPPEPPVQAQRSDSTPPLDFAAEIPEIQPQPLPEIPAAMAQLADLNRADSAAAGVAAEGGGGDAMALRPRHIKWPEAPMKIIQKRKIDASVELQALVGSDGRVRDVRILQGIANCEECTQSAIDAVRNYVYDPPPAGRDAVWTTPLSFRFSHRR